MSDNGFADLNDLIDNEETPVCLQETDARFACDDRYPQLLLNYLLGGYRVRLMPTTITGYDPVRHIDFEREK
ncbi:hypothetical protein KY359_04595 [Candidatus Woesearchaeota archaeon]|nr:hypothetical protein [Candidatus Woesearchaeota archaeon]